MQHPPFMGQGVARPVLHASGCSPEDWGKLGSYLGSSGMGRLLLFGFPGRSADKSWAQAELGREQVATADTRCGSQGTEGTVIGWEGEHLEEERGTRQLAT